MGAQLRGEKRKGETSQGRIRIDSGGDSLKGQTAPPENPKNPGKRRLKKKHPTPINSGQKPFFLSDYFSGGLGLASSVQLP